MAHASRSPSPPKAFTDLRAFLAFLKDRNLLVEVAHPVDPRWEITAIRRRLLASGGPAVLFHRVIGHSVPLVTNLFGTTERVALAVGRTPDELESLGQLLARLREPGSPRNLREGLDLARQLAQVRHLPNRSVRHPPCQERILTGEAVDLARLFPIETCWPEDAGPLITWPLVITAGPNGGPVNIGVYRLQVIGRNRLIMRWLKHRGGAEHLRQHRGPMPVAVAIGADPATILAAVTPVPESLSEYGFAGLLRQKRVETATALTSTLPVPAQAEIILEGSVDPNDLAPEGPFGDHTGYYNEIENFPVFTVHTVTTRRNPLYLSTFTGRPPDEPAILAVALNRVFTPLLQARFPEITAFHLPMEACSYRMAVVALDKAYPGHAFRVMTGVWGFLRQFLYTKVILVVDATVAVTDWEAVMGAVAANLHPGRDIQLFTNTPIDYLDFASPVAGLGGKMGLDATTKDAAEQAATPPMAPCRPLPGWPGRLTAALPRIRSIHPRDNGRMAVVLVDKQTPGEGRRIIEAIWNLLPPGGGADQLWILDADLDPNSWDDLIWSLATRFDPGRDLLLDRPGGRFGIDATTKLPGETNRVWGRVLTMDPAITAKVEANWSAYGLP
ncbi:MAG: UbiD family decarboxylase [Magnetococcales bacterium]|nr:UbiD family decarboxylase [Magnetococcales bacterium]